jgi:hypothetical protein
MQFNPQARVLSVRILIIVATCVIGWALLGVYSVGPSYAAYVAPARAFLRAAVALDSAALARQADTAVVRWTVRVAREDATSLRALERGLYLGSGTQRADSTVVWFGARALGQCVDWSLRMYFVGRGDATRIGKVMVFCATAVSRPPGSNPPGRAGPAR